MRWQNRFLLLMAFTTAILFSPLGHAQNYFFHLLGVAGGQGFVWTGASGDNDWNNPFNWSTNAVPGVGDVASFKGAACAGANCNANLSGNISVLGVDIDVGYAGTIAQGVGYTITIGTSGWTQAGGTFTGGDSNITFTASNLALSGAAVFTATTGQTYFNKTTGLAADVISTSAGVTLTFPDLSIQKFHLVSSCTAPYYRLNTANKVSFYNLILSTGSTGCGSAHFGHSTIAVEIRNDFTNATAISTDHLTYQGTYELYGNMSLAAGDASRLALWKWMGATNSTYATAGSFGVGAIQVEKTGGATVTPFAGTTQFETAGVYVKTGEFTFPTALAIYKVNNGHEVFRVDTGTTVNVPVNSTLSIFVGGACGSPIYEMNVDSNFNFENVVLTGGNSGCGQGTLAVNAADTVTVKKNLTLGNDHRTTGNWILEGNLVKGPSAVVGAISLTLQGTAAQALDTVAWGTGPIIVNKASGTASLSANFTVSSAAPAVTVQSGVLSLNAKNLTITNALTVEADGKVLCAGGTLSAGSYVINGEISCGTGVGITWTGATGDNLWTTAGNWTNNNIPGATDVAIFSSDCAGANCNASIVSNISVKGIWITSTYPGILTQDSTRTITVAASGWTQAGGTFAGGDSVINMNGPFSLTGGTFVSTTATLISKGNFTISGGATVFTHNSGTVGLDFTSNITYTVNATGFPFNHVNFNGTNGYSAIRTITGSLTVNGNLTADVTGSYTGNVNSGNIYVKGNISFLTRGVVGSTVIHAVGTADQTITGTAVTAYSPSLVINSTGGTVFLVGGINLQGNFTYTQGTVDAGTSLIVFTFTSSGVYTLSLASPLTLFNVTFAGAGYNSTRTFSGSELTVNGTLTCDSQGGNSGYLNSGTINAKGDVVFLNSGCIGTGTINVSGTGNQTVSGVATSYSPSLKIDSTGGVVTLSGTLTMWADFTYNQGTVAAGTSTVKFYFYSSDTSLLTLNAPLELGNVSFTGNGYSAVRTFSGSPLTVNGTLIIDPTSSVPNINGSTIIAKGDVSVSNFGSTGTTILEIGGSGNQSITGVAGSRFLQFVINSTGGTVSLFGTLDFGSHFTYTQGTVAAGTSTANFYFYSSVTSTININAPLELYNVTFVGSGTSSARNFTGGNTLTTNGTLTINPSSSVATINSGSFVAKGNVVFNSLGSVGTSTLTMSGNTNSTLLLQNTAAGRTFTGAVTISKTVGAKVTMLADALWSTGQNVTIASGTLDLGGYVQTVNTTLTIDATGTLACSGGLYYQGTLVNNGTINCPGAATYPFQWTGAGGDSNWNTAGNWQGGVVPGASDVPAFTDTYCTPNCDVTINVPISIKGFESVAPYTGTITQGSGSTIAVGIRGWKQPAGNFVGNNANITITGTGAKFSVTGTSTFTAPNATLELFGYQSGTNDAVFTVGSSATFTPNGGTVKFSLFANWSTHPTYVIDVPTMFQFSNVILHQSAALNTNDFGYGPVTGRTIVVTGNLTHGASQFASGAGASKVEGLWQVQGNFNIGTDAIGGAGTVTLNGTGAQVITADANAWSANLGINKASGAVTMNAASTTLRIRAFFLDQGTFTAPTGTLESYAYNGVNNDTIFRVAAGATFNTNGGTVRFAENAPWNVNINYVIDVPNLFQFNNVILHQGVARNSNSFTYAPVAGRTIVVAGNLTHGTGFYIVASGNSKMSGLWHVYGNLSIGQDAMAGGTGSITLNGTGAQTISQTTGPVGGGTFIVNKTSGTATLLTNLALSTALQDLTITAGTLNMAGFNLTVARNISNSGVLRRGTSPACGTVSQGGTFTGTAAICPP